MLDLFHFQKCVKKLQKGASLIPAVDRERYRYIKLLKVTDINVYKHIDITIIC